MNKKPYILGICAANSGSGKTYVIENLIPELKKRGYSSSAIKHALEQINQPTDIILVGGLKTMQIPKIEVYQEKISRELLHNKDKNIIGVISDVSIKCDIPCVNFINIDKITEFIITLIENEKNNLT